MPHPLINKVALSYSNTHVATSEFGKTKGSENIIENSKPV